MAVKIIGTIHFQTEKLALLCMNNNFMGLDLNKKYYESCLKKLTKKDK